MSGLSDLSVEASPYPGLRPFRGDEADIFFGREEYVDHLLEKLGQNRFLAVMGPSGCGKSSLMQAGVIPALETGFLAEAGAEWRIAIMRPGNHPMERLGESLLAPAALGSERAGTAAAAAILQATLLRGPLGLVEVLRETPLPEATSLLLLVDQFEEIFRFRQQGYSSEAEADAFVELLLATAAQWEVSVYVVLTMRSDFLGDCALFHDLPETINNRQFLTPRLTRAQQRIAVEGPAAVFGGTVEAALVNALLNDMGPDPDQLPLMQHALMRMWTQKAAAAAQAGDNDVQEAGITLTLADYVAVGRLNEALSRHADEAFAELDERYQRVAEVLFRCLSERSLERRDTRRPVPLSTVAAVAGVSWEQVAEVVEVFRRPDRSFITPPVGMALHPETILDISYESLIRQWRRMTKWVEDEAGSAETYRHLERTARLWQAEPDAQRRKDYLWHGHELGRALEWRTQESPTSIWAERYGTAFDLAMPFLDASAEAEEAQRQQQEAAQRRKLRRTRWQLCGALIAAGAAFFLWRTAVQERAQAQVQRQLALAGRVAARAGTVGTESAGGQLVTLLSLAALRIGEKVGHMVPEARLALFASLMSMRQWVHHATYPEIFMVDKSTDHRFIAAASQDGTALVWSFPDMQQVQVKHGAPIWSVALSPDGHYPATVGADGITRLWDVGTGQQVWKKDWGTALGAVMKTAANADHTVMLAFGGKQGATLAQMTGDGRAWLWSVPEGNDYGTVMPQDENGVTKPDFAGQPLVDAAYMLALSSGGCYLPTVKSNILLKLWNICVDNDNAPVERQFPKGDEIRSIVFSPNSNLSYVAYSTAKGEVEILDPTTGKTVSQLDFGLPTGSIPQSVPQIAFSPDGLLLATAGLDQTARIFNVADGTEKVRINAGQLSSVEFSPDGRYLAGAGVNNTAYVWDVKFGNEQGRVATSYAIGDILFSPDGQQLATLSGGSLGRPFSLDVWDWSASQAGEVARIQLQHQTGEIDFSADGRSLIAIDETGAVNVWDVNSGKSAPTFTIATQAQR